MSHFLQLCLAFAAGEFVGAFFLLFFLGAFRKPDGAAEPEETDNVVVLRRRGA